MQPLHLAASRGLTDMVRLLLDLGADPASRTNWGLTPMAHALEHGHRTAADLLRARGAPADPASALFAGDFAALDALPAAAPHELRTQLLFAAARNGLVQAAAILIRHGADPAARVHYLLGETPAPVAPLHLAARHGHDDVAHVLLDAGAPPNPGTEDGLPTPLHLAAGGGHVAVVRTLLAHGADRHATDKSFGATPLGWAEFDGHDDVAALLRETLHPPSPAP